MSAKTPQPEASPVVEEDAEVVEAEIVHEPFRLDHNWFEQMLAGWPDRDFVAYISSPAARLAEMRQMYAGQQARDDQAEVWRQLDDVRSQAAAMVAQGRHHFRGQEPGYTGGLDETVIHTEALFRP